MQPFGLMNYAETHELTPKCINTTVNGNNEQSLNAESWTLFRHLLNINSTNETV